MSFEQVLEERGYLVYTIVGTSMYPLLRQRRDIVEIRRKGDERCRKYDVALYKRGGRYILHRVLAVRPDDYVFAGDHCAHREYVTDGQILGVMTRVIRDGKEILPDDWRYRLYTHLWCDLFPLRAGILRIRFLLGRLKRKLQRHSMEKRRSVQHGRPEEIEAVSREKP